MKILNIVFIGFISLVGLTACEKSTSSVDRNCEAHPYQYISKVSSNPYYITFLPLSQKSKYLRFFVLETNEIVFNPEDYLKNEANGYTISITYSEGLIKVDRMDLPLPLDSSESVDGGQYKYDPNQGLQVFSSAGQRFELISCEGFYSRDFRQRYGLQ